MRSADHTAENVITAQPQSVWDATGLKATLLSVFCAFGGWSLLMPVIPHAVIVSGGSESLAGLSTGVFMAATVITQALIPWILGRIGALPVLAASGLLLGLPAAVHVWDFSPAVVLAVAVLRGIGFGAVTVTQATLIALLVPPSLVGRSSAVFGAVVGFAQLVFFPVGLWLQSVLGDQAPYVLAVVLGVAGAAAACGLPAPQVQEAEVAEGSAAVPREPPPAEVPASPAPTWRLLAVPGLSIMVAAISFSAFSTFLAPAAETIDAAAAATIAGWSLSVIGGAQMLSKIFAGYWTDRKGQPGYVLPWGLALCAVGVAAVGWGLDTETLDGTSSGGQLLLWALLTAGVFGIGFGVVQGESLLLMFHRLPRHRSATASAAWNMTFDSGTGSGAIMLGFIVGGAAYQSGFFIAAVLVMLGLFVVIGEQLFRRGQKEQSSRKN